MQPWLIKPATQCVCEVFLVTKNNLISPCLACKAFLTCKNNPGTHYEVWSSSGYEGHSKLPSVVVEVFDWQERSNTPFMVWDTSGLPHKNLYPLCGRSSACSDCQRLHIVVQEMAGWNESVERNVVLFSQTKLHGTRPSPSWWYATRSKKTMDGCILLTLLPNIQKVLQHVITQGNRTIIWLMNL